MKEETKRKWAPPEVRRYGTFQDVTRAAVCQVKTFGSGDGMIVGIANDSACKVTGS